MTVQAQPKSAPATVAAGRKATAVIVGVGLLAGLTLASVLIGSGDIPAADVWSALWNGSGSTTDLLVRDFRVPRPCWPSWGASRSARPARSSSR